MKLLQELRRRQMFRLTGLYIVGAWLAIQVADIAFPSWGIPESAIRFLFYAAFLCFPIALVFGWIFDIRRDGIFRTRKAGPHEVVDVRMRWQDYIVLTALAGVGIFILLGSAERIRTESGTEPTKSFAVVERRQNSVAVLPFENLDPNPETGYFSDGVADEILSKLANMRSLFVLARNSSYTFRNGVEYLLSGTVRRDGDLVRVTARLIAEDGSHVWSQSFDRRLEKALAIQEEIAYEVANRIVAQVSGPKGVEVTESIVPEAYTNYLLGKKLFLERPHLWHENAPRLFRQAIALDPDFAPAYAYLAICLSLFGLPPERLDEVEAANDKATELAPYLAETIFAKALLVDRRDNDTQASIALLRQAIELDPTLSTAYNVLGISLSRQGQIAEAHRVHETALNRDPLNPLLITNVAWHYLDSGEFDRGERLMLRMTQLPEEPQFFHRQVKTMYYQLGRYDEYIRWSKDQVRKTVQREWEPERRDRVRAMLFNSLGAHAYAYLQIGLRESALQLLELVAERHPDDIGRRAWQAELCFAKEDFDCAVNVLEALRNDMTEDVPDWLTRSIGANYLLAGNHEKAIENLEPQFTEGELQDQLDDSDAFDLFHHLVFAYRADGRDDTARRLAHEAGSILDARIETMGLSIEPSLTQVALSRWLRGDYEGAIEAFRKTVDAGWIYLYEAQEDPLWREFLQIADFGDELSAVEAEIERQRAVVEAADATDDFSDVVDALMAQGDEQT
jgi:TolB-like protein/Flp pilus assembly protein TadD